MACSTPGQRENGVRFLFSPKKKNDETLFLAVASTQPDRKSEESSRTEETR